MFTQSQIEILASLDAYFAETPQRVITAEVEAVSALEFEGATAKDYFDSFSQHFDVELSEISLDTTIGTPDFVGKEHNAAKLKAA